MTLVFLFFYFFFFCCSGCCFCCPGIERQQQHGGLFAEEGNKCRLPRQRDVLNGVVQQRLIFVRLPVTGASGAQDFLRIRTTNVPSQIPASLAKATRRNVLTLLLTSSNSENRPLPLIFTYKHDRLRIHKAPELWLVSLLTGM